MSAANQSDSAKINTGGALKSKVAAWSLWLAIAAGIVLALAGPLFRMDVTGLMTSFSILRFTPIAAIGIVLIALAGLAESRVMRDGRGSLKAIGAIVISAVVIAMPLNQRMKAAGVPPIHDITTDTQDPPAFVDVVPLRKDAPNPADYQKDGGAKLAAQQEAAYPDIKPLILSVPPDKAFAKALGVAKSMGWDIVAEAQKDGRIEATATTFWFGFKDDIVIRIRQVADGSRVDIRSESRIGLSDIGVNAKRVRAFLKALKNA
ncbi:MAG TPA: DUF1499 domain-containing protein [Alphaproteobacteria bacterium]|nr:DUF1499 domain-containing protein [Alphaproteobacteria bacterium]